MSESAGKIASLIAADTVLVAELDGQLVGCVGLQQKPGFAYAGRLAVDRAARGMARDRACIGVSYCTALMRAKHNDLGQYATGCVPRDRMYADDFRRARESEGWT